MCYEQVNAMLLNEFLKEHRKVEDLKKDFQAAVAQQHKQIETLTAGLQKVSAELEASKPAPQVVKHPRAAPAAIKQHLQSAVTLLCMAAFCFRRVMLTTL
jgi:phage shock protein A